MVHVQLKPCEIHSDFPNKGNGSQLPKGKGSRAYSLNHLNKRRMSFYRHLKIFQVMNSLVAFLEYDPPLCRGTSRILSQI